MKKLKVEEMDSFDLEQKYRINRIMSLYELLRLNVEHYGVVRDEYSCVITVIMEEEQKRVDLIKEAMEDWKKLGKITFEYFILKHVPINASFIIDKSAVEENEEWMREGSQN